MTTLHRLTIELDDDLAQKLADAASARGWTPESLAADCVGQHLEIAVRHRALVERFEAVDQSLATLAQFVGEATPDAQGIDLFKICRYGRKGS